MTNSSRSETTEAAESRAAGRRVFAIIVGFFATFIAVDALFVWLASSSHSGPVTEAAYDKGLDYNTRIAAAADEATLGWTMEATANRQENGETEIWLIMRDAEGLLFPGLEISGRLVRPVVSGFDQSLEFTPLGEGQYHVALTIPEPGQWELRVLAQDKSNTRRFTKRLIL